MSKVLIVESGSSKADWLLLENGVSKLSFQTKGWNPLFMTQEEMQVRFQSYHDLKGFYKSIDQVFFYAPGCSHEESRIVLRDALVQVFVNALVEVESDLLAAARSVYKGKALFVSILGTGSNTAFYDGEVLEAFTPSLGYILGDEGSGAALGKRLLVDYLYENLPNDLYSEFSKTHSISKELVLSSVYKQENPNRFLASYVPFLVAHKSHPRVIELVKSEFQNYLDAHLISNPMCREFPIAFVGSVAFYFQEVLKELCFQNDLLMCEVIQSPIHHLEEYHRRKIDRNKTR
ncbi:hypothetical protein N9Y06_02420 [Flavobacteriales bacterium]|nr:hypothetical protein [Flavobacteriales bacterium]